MLKLFNKASIINPIKPFYIIWLFILFIFASCGSKEIKKEKKEDEQPKSKSTQYANPVFEPVLADPSIVKAADGWFYGYGTEDDWGDGKGNRLVPVLKSKDLIKWTIVGNAFSVKPTWKNQGGLWAVDVVMVNNTYHMYYSYSLWGDPNPGIGVATSTTPNGPFSDKGKLFLSKEIGIPNTIDPFYFTENNKKYLFFGSYSTLATQGTFVVELTNDGLALKDVNNKVKIAAGDYEAVMIHKRKNYYYFFASKGGCCSGANSTYNVRVARSESLLGPYLDKAGIDIKQRGSGTLLLEGNSKFAGPGHNSRIHTDKNGTDWLMYHAIDRTNGTVPSGASRRMLMLDRISWENDWPVIRNAVPSLGIQDGPEF